jgi:hypothetical protein
MIIRNFALITLLNFGLSPIKAMRATQFPLLGRKAHPQMANYVNSKKGTFK